MEKFELVPSVEEIKRKYIYRDNSNPEHRIVFECEARGILEADGLYEKHTGKDPRMQSYVGCSIEDSYDSEKNFKKEIIKNMDIPVEKKMEMVLLVTQKKPVTDLQFCSDTWQVGQAEKDIDRDQIRKLFDDFKLLNLSGKIDLDELDEITERDDEGIETIKLRRFLEVLVAKNEEDLIKMEKASDEGNHNVVGEMYGFPQSARAVFDEPSKGFFRSELPAEIKEKEWYPYITFGILSKDKWQEEIETAKNWMETVKHFDPELHQKYVDWARSEWLKDELGDSVI